MILKGKAVLVTGASSGIGEATARCLAANGAKVYAVARRLDRLEKLASETGCIPIQLDVRDRQGIKDLAANCPVDILVNNAGVGRALGKMWDASDEDIELTVDTNLTSLLLMTKAFLPRMIERGVGHVVNMSSATASYPLAASLYASTKAAIHKLCRDLRVELQGTGIRVTEINPGRVVSEFYDVAINDAEQLKKTVENQCVDLMPDDIAEAILYCVSAPWRVNVSQMEVMPTEQVYGGAHFVPFLNRKSEDVWL